MSQLTSSNCSANGASNEWDFGAGTYHDEEVANRSHSNSTIEDNSTNDYIPGTFEGPEKTLEVIFNHNIGTPGGLRNMNRAQLDELCTQAKCTILSKASTQQLDAYVLSESSLFVYDYRLVMKTCGTTTLLRCLATLFEYSDKLGMELSWVGYSRKNFLFPSAQLWPHVNFGEEMRYIEQHDFLDKRLRGHGHILGPVTGDHWFVFVADGSPVSSRFPSPITTPNVLSASSSVLDLPAHGASPRAPSVLFPATLSAKRERRAQSLGADSTSGEDEDEKEMRSRRDNNKPQPELTSAADLRAALDQFRSQRHSTYRTFNMMMFDMDPAVAATFFQSVNGFTGKEMTVAAGVPTLCPDFLIDEAAFEPCGYSMNAVKDQAYSTIHITPEAQCSYVSFETNEQLEDYTPLLRRVLAAFRPQRFVLTMFGDDDAIACLPRLPTSHRCYEDIDGCAANSCYLRTSSTSTTVEAQRQQCVMACYAFVAPVAAE